MFNHDVQSEAVDFTNWLVLLDFFYASIPNHEGHPGIISDGLNTADHEMS